MLSKWRPAVNPDIRWYILEHSTIWYEAIWIVMLTYFARACFKLFKSRNLILISILIAIELVNPLVYIFFYLNFRSILLIVTIFQVIRIYNDVFMVGMPFFNVLLRVFLARFPKPSGPWLQCWAGQCVLITVEKIWNWRLQESAWYSHNQTGNAQLQKTWDF